MSDYTDLLERARDGFGSPRVSLEVIQRRQDRRRRNRRLGSALVAVVIAVLALGGAIRAFDRPFQPEPSNRLTPDNVKDLTPTWSARLDGEASQIQIRAFEPDIVQTFPPTVADGKIFVVTSAGTLYAFDASCAAGETCPPLWTADAAAAIGIAPGHVIPIGNPPTVADGLVFVSANGGHLLAFPADCAPRGGLCQPVWVAETGDAIDQPVVTGGVVYGVDGRHGIVYAFSEACGTGGAVCEPLWTAKTEPYAQNAYATSLFIWRVAVSNGVVYAVGASEHPDQVFAFDAATGRRLWWGRSVSPPRGGAGQTGTTPIVADGFVLVSFGFGASNSGLSAFPVGCRLDGGECPPAWTLPDANAPLVSNGIAYVNPNTDASSSGTLSAVRLDCVPRGGECAPAWTVPTDTGFGDLAAGEGMVFTTSQIGTTTLEAFPAVCGNDGPPCGAAWKTRDLGAPSFPPVVADGVVYLATQDGRVYAFATDCGTGGATCEPIWEGAGTSPPAIVGTNLYTLSADGQLHAFGLPPS